MAGRAGLIQRRAERLLVGDSLRKSGRGSENDMDHFLREYLKEGLWDVVSIANEEHEEESGSYDHMISETVVAQKGDGFVKVSASIHTNRYKAGRSGIDSRE